MRRVVIFGLLASGSNVGWGKPSMKKASKMLKYLAGKGSRDSTSISKHTTTVVTIMICSIALPKVRYVKDHLVRAHNNYHNMTAASRV